MKKLLLAFCFASLLGCTANQRAKTWGGTATVQLSAGKKLVNATWKQDSLWLLTKEFKQGDSPENYTFTEDSSFGLVQGTVIIKETR